LIFIPNKLLNTKKIMDQKKLYKTVETIASQIFNSEKDMLIAVLKQIVGQKETNIIGGRIWQLNNQKEAYKLLYQTGKIERIPLPSIKEQIRRMVEESKETENS